MSRVLVLCAVMALSACTTVQFNDGATIALKHENSGPEWMALVNEKAVEQCKANGKTGAELLKTTPAHTALPEWMVPKVSTYRCT